MQRPMYNVTLTMRAAMCLREAVRPLTPTPYGQAIIVKFCEKLYRALLYLETRQVSPVAFVVLSVEEVMIINHFISTEDGDWAADLLRQTREVLHEWHTGKTPVQLADPAVMAELLNSAATEPDGSTTGP